jgi:4-hydroxybenzoyl-CoA thioesterase
MPPFSYTFPVRFADVDHAGIVYYPRFFHYFHTAFEEFFRHRMGGSAYVDLLDRRRIGFPAVRCECDYRSPVRFGDLLRADMTIDRMGAKSIRFRYRLYRIEQAAGARSATDELSAEGLVVCVVTDLANFRGVEIPEDLRQLFLELVVDTE